MIKTGCDITIIIEKESTAKSYDMYALALADTFNFIEINNGRMIRIQ